MKDFYVYTLMQHKRDYNFKGDWVQARPIFDSYLLAGAKKLPNQNSIISKDQIGKVQTIPQGMFVVLREPDVDKALSLIRSKILENIGQVQNQAECQLGILQSQLEPINTLMA
jgi:hypothetical protein